MPRCAAQQFAGQQVAPFIEPGAQAAFKQTYGAHGDARLLAQRVKAFFQRAIAIHVFRRGQEQAAQAGIAQPMPQGGAHGGFQNFRHAGGGEANVDVDPDKVVIVLTDHGPGIADVEKAMQEGWSTAPDNVRSLGFGAGMGLPNMKKYSDEMTIDSVVGQGTTLKMVVYAQSEKS